MNCDSLTDLNKSLLFGVIEAALVVILPASTAFATIDASLQMQLGNPSGAIVDTNNHAHYLVQRGSNLRAQPVFTTVATGIAGQVGTTSYTDTTATNNVPYFYRVGVQ